MVRRAIAVLMLPACLVGAGCGETSPGTPKLAAQAAPDLDKLRYPLDAFDLTDTEAVTLARARHLLTQRCARRFGAEIPARRPGPARPPRGERYGLADAGLARTWAYSPSIPLARPAHWQSEIEAGSRTFLVVNGASPQGRKAGIAGLPVGGCEGAAERTLRKGVATGAKSPIPALDEQALRASRNDPAVKRAAGEWKRCMERQGYRIDDPVEGPFRYWGQKRAAGPRPSREQARKGVPPSSRERRGALWDVACKQESGFVRVWIAADMAEQRGLVARDLRRLTDHRRRLDTEVRNAEHALR
ncbi:hypothetical protein [Spirillospora sp. CA-294931]|uniref:hypothetical protein n=1 Tax=Spirillospora sp. CA-294931 TaxID=3240042 RepID=UPI003D920E9D